LHEICYEGRLHKNLTGKLIYHITSNNFLSKIARSLANFAPSLKANTFGVGVRFRSMNEWRFMVERKMVIKGILSGDPERHSIIRRLFLNISNVKRVSVLAKKMP